MRLFGKRRQSGKEIMIGFVLFILVMVVWYVTPRGVTVDCEIKPIEGREIENSSFPVRELWAVSGLQPGNFHDGVLFVSTSGHLMVADTLCNRIIAAQFQTGAVVWQKGEVFTPSNITLDEVRQRIYVSATQNILALSVADGERIWSNVSDHLIRNAHPVTVNSDGQLTVEANGEWAIDPDTGELSPVVVSTEPAISDLTPEVIMWRYLATIGSPSIASNVVASNNIIYALDERAQLHFISSADGRALGTVAFEPPVPTRLLYEPGAIGGSWLAVENDLVAIYFQDTHMLTVYEVDMPQSHGMGKAA